MLGPSGTGVTRVCGASTHTSRSSRCVCEMILIISQTQPAAVSLGVLSTVCSLAPWNNKTLTPGMMKEELLLWACQVMVIEPPPFTPPHWPQRDPELGHTSGLALLKTYLLAGRKRPSLLHRRVKIFSVIHFTSISFSIKKLVPIVWMGIN